MSDIFICYSRTDSAIATQLVQHLRTAGWSVFMDVQTHVGRRWHREIEKELHAARAVVPLWSANSRDSDFVLEEADYGKRKEILFPAFIEQVEFPYGFGRIQTADMVGWVGEAGHPGLAQLLEALQLYLGTSQSHAPHSPQPEPDVVLPKPGQTFRNQLKRGGEGPLMVVIPPGRFLMGSPPDEPGRFESESPLHEVNIVAPFALGAYAVTFDEYDRFAVDVQRKKPDDEGWGRGSRPVINVSWDDAQAYCVWLSAQTGCRYRLPSEAEWEYACRAGTTTPFHTGERISTDQANFNGKRTYSGSAKGEYRGQTLPVGWFADNAFGLYDMHGNVWEWCQDRWHNRYDGAPEDGSAWETSDDLPRVLRGGAWYLLPRDCRAAFRLHFVPSYRNCYIGFRICCSVPIE